MGDVKTLKGRRFFFATRSDLRPGLLAIEESIDLECVVYKMRAMPDFTLIDALSSHAGLGQTSGHDVNTSPIYLLFRRGAVPAPKRVRQQDGGDKFIIEPSSNCLILRSGGLHISGALVAGELQLPLNPSSEADDMFALCARELFRGFTRVKLYHVGPEALRGLRNGQRLATISIDSPDEYNLTAP